MYFKEQSTEIIMISELNDTLQEKSTYFHLCLSLLLLVPFLQRVILFSFFFFLSKKESRREDEKNIREPLLCNFKTLPVLSKHIVGGVSIET